MAKFCRENSNYDTTSKPSPTPSTFFIDDLSEMRSDLAVPLQAKVFPEFEKMRRNGQLCDVKIRCGETYFMAHRCVLAAAVPFFDAMFNAEFIESKEDEIQITEVLPDVLEAILNFVYTGRIEFSAHNIQPLMSAADFFQLDILSHECARFLQKKMSHANVLGIRRLALCHNSVKTTQAADRFIQKHFVAVSESEEWLQYDVDTVVDVLARDELHVDCEEQVFEAAMRWLQHSDRRKKDAARILAQVRMPLLEKTFLADQVATNSLVRNSISCRDLIDEAKDYHLIPERRDSLRTFKVRERLCSDIPGIIYVCGGLYADVEMFDPMAGRWFPVNSMCSIRTRVGVATLHGELYVLGGCNNNNSRVNMVEVFDPKRNTWKEAEPMLQPRSAMCAVTWNSKVVILGGFDGTSALDTVEIYNAETKRWQCGQHMNSQRCAAAAAVLNGFIYVAGGHNSFAIFDTVERYNPKTRSWEAVRSMLSKRCRHSMVAYNNKLYVIGGYDGKEFLRTTEIFDLDTGSWSLGPELNIRRARVSCCLNGQAIYAIGGYDGVCNISSMEILHLERDPPKEEDQPSTSKNSEARAEEPLQWNMAPNMKLHEGGVGVGVIPASPRQFCGLDVQRRPRLSRATVSEEGGLATD